ncbi:MAG: hypothetical protein OXE44_04180 [Nitrospinae bacterium]|nr:hypothetical protein [Nitrospinota bacterium]
MGNSQSWQRAQDSAMCGDEAVSIEVFQDLTLTARDGQRSALRDALHRNATTPWRHAEEREREFPTTSSEFLAFQRASGDNLAASGLTLCAREDGYEVVNIVPLEDDELGTSGYNDILNDFIERVVGPASQELEFDIVVTPRKQSITDWTSDEVASALHTFSVCANKSTGAGHPADRKRWFEFLFAAHAANTRLDAELLGRWLVEAEKWPPEVAFDLVDRYQYSMDLLKSGAAAP